MKRFILIIIGLILCASCSVTRKPIVEPEREVSKDTVYINHQQRDSIYVHDSVYYEVMTKGDTVWQTKEVFRYRYRDIEIHDTTYVSRTDTLVQVLKTNELTSWQNKQIKFGWFAMAVCLGGVLFFILKFFLK